MKRILTASIVTLLALLLSGCFISLDNGAGSVGIRIPEPRSITGTDPAEIGRIYVINESVTLPLGDGDEEYVEFEFPTDDTTLESFTVGPVPTGDGYQIILVFGAYQTGVTGEEIFVPSLYAMSDPLSVYAGQATETEVLSMEATPFVQVGGTLGRDLVGIVYDGARVYVATDSTLYVSDTGAPDDQGLINFDVTVNAPGGRSINSIDLGADENDGTGNGEGPTVWVNTTAGVLPYVDSDGDAVPDTLDTSFDDASQLETTSILDSGAFFLGADLYGYVQFDGGLSAVRDINGGGGPPGVPEWISPSDLSEIIVGEPIYDLAVQDAGGNIFGYFATKLGAFQMSNLTIDANPQTIQEVFDNSFFFQLQIDGARAIVTQIAVDGADVYLGSPRGAVRVADASQIGVSNNAVVNGTLLPFTEGLIVEEIVIGGGYIVVLTNQSLVYSNDGGSTYTTTPIAAGSSGEITGVLLDTTSGVVLLATATGLIGIDIS